MKKVLLITIVLAFLISFGLVAADDDYKVIKNAVKGKGGGALTDADLKDAMFYMTVEDIDTKKIKIKIQIPMELVLVLDEMCPDEEINFNGNQRVKLKKVIGLLKKSGKTSLVEITDYEEDAKVKIWIE